VTKLLDLVPDILSKFTGKEKKVKQDKDIDEAIENASAKTDKNNR